MAVLKYKDENGVWQELPVGGDTEIVGTDGIEVTKGDDGNVEISGKNFIKCYTGSKLFTLYGQYGGKNDSFDVVNNPTISSNGNIPSYVSDGTYIATLRTGTPKIGKDAANKEYVDDCISTVILELSKRYHHYLTLSVTTDLGESYFYYDFVNDNDSGITDTSELGNIPEIPDDKMVVMSINLNGYYFAIPALIYSNVSWKIIAHGLVTTDGNTTQYLTVQGAEIIEVTDHVIQE